MTKEFSKIILGDEYDDSLREAIREVLKENGAVGIDKSWGVGGSQEIETFSVQINNDQLVIESETFIGLSISGPKLITERIASEIRNRTTSKH